MAYTGQSLYKAMLLYLLRHASVPLSNNALSRFLLDYDYTDYFHAEEAIHDLLAIDHIAEKKEGAKTIYTLTDAGKQTALTIESALSGEIREEMDRYLSENAYAFRNDASAAAGYRREENGDYLVSLELREQESLLLSVSLRVAEREDAERIAHNWPEKSEHFYRTAFRELQSP